MRWAWLATASPQHCLLIRRHLKTGELAFHYCFVPEGQPLTQTRLIRAAGLQMAGRRDVPSSARTASASTSPRSGSTPRSPATPSWSWPRSPSAPVTAALLRDRTDTQAPRPIRPDQPPPADPGMIPLTVPEIARLLAAHHQPARPATPQHWPTWRRRHQARARWYHQRTRLARDTPIALVS